jgi:glyoxylase-like metal-dependent hydrolase (beta-lactamase superfamily II)
VRLAHAQSSRAAGLALTDLGGGLSVIAGAGGNVVVHSGSEGLLLVDSGAPTHATELAAFLAERFGSTPVGVLFNTHWHLDHTGGNDALVGGRSIPIVAHENTRLWMSTKFYSDWEERYYERRAAAARPNRTFFTSDRQPLTLDFGGEEVVYGHLLEAHTDGDIYVALPDADVIAVGDVIAPVRDPVLDWYGGGWLGGRLDAQERLLEIGDRNTRYVPAFGPVVGRAEVQAEHDMLLALFERFVEHIRLGKTARDMFEEGIHAGLGRDFADPAKLIRDCYEGFWAHHNALVNDIV